MRGHPLLWLAGLLGLAAVLGIVFDDPLAARGVGPGAIGLLALLAAFALGAAGLFRRKPEWILVWLSIVAALALAYRYFPGLAEWWAGRP